MKVLGLFILAILMVGLSYFCTTLPNLKAQVAGWAGILFFGLGFIAFPVLLFRSGPQVIIDEKGIEDRRSRMGMIPWEDVREVWVGSVHSTRFLCVEVTENGKYLSKLPKHQRMLAEANVALGFPPITICFSGLSPSLDEVLEYIQANHDTKIGGEK
jgi:hypothetical protein